MDEGADEEHVFEEFVSANDNSSPPSVADNNGSANKVRVSQTEDKPNLFGNDNAFNPFSLTQTQTTNSIPQTNYSSVSNANILQNNNQQYPQFSQTLPNNQWNQNNTMFSPSKMQPQPHFMPAQQQASIQQPQQSTLQQTPMQQTQKFNAQSHIMSFYDKAKQQAPQASSTASRYGAL